MHLSRAIGFLLLAALIVCGSPLSAGKDTPFSARSGLDAAGDAARTWAPDARLVYVENDEDVTANGTAVRWGYLYQSQLKGKARGYSVKNGKIMEAADLGFDFDAPPLPDGWIDSAKALAVAEEKAGQKYRTEHNGRLATMLLIRGAFHEKKPDVSTWTLLYTSDTEPSLFIVVDADKGKVVKTWRG